MNEQKIISDLAAFADSGKHTKFKLLQTWQEYSHYRKVRNSTKVLIRFLQDIMDVQIKSYCKDVESGNSDVLKFLAYGYLAEILDCYEVELKVVQDMLDEYECYLLAGNWLDFVFNSQRPFEKLYDHRGE